jgi:hypothetical protein
MADQEFRDLAHRTASTVFNDSLNGFSQSHFCFGIGRSFF